MHLNRIKYVIFDCDGVFFDSVHLATQIKLQVKKELGYSASYQEEVRTFSGLAMNHPTILEELHRLPCTYWADVDQRCADVYKDHLRPLQGVFSTLTSFKFPICVASSSEPDWLEYKLSLTDLKPFFPEATFHGRSAMKGKPDPGFYLHVAEQMGWPTSECLVVDESRFGIQAAKAAGMSACGFVGGAHVFKEYKDLLLHAGADFLVDDFASLQILLAPGVSGLQRSSRSLH